MFLDWLSYFTSSPRTSATRHINQGFIFSYLMCVQCLVESLICISWWLITLNISSCAYLPSFIHFGKTFPRILIGWLISFLLSLERFSCVEYKFFVRLVVCNYFSQPVAGFSFSQRGSHGASHLVVSAPFTAYPALSGALLALAPRPRSVHVRSKSFSLLADSLTIPYGIFFFTQAIMLSVKSCFIASC